MTKGGKEKNDCLKCSPSHLAGTSSCNLQLDDLHRDASTFPREEEREELMLRGMELSVLVEETADPHSDPLLLLQLLDKLRLLLYSN